MLDKVVLLYIKKNVIKKNRKYENLIRDSFDFSFFNSKINLINNNIYLSLRFIIIIPKRSPKWIDRYVVIVAQHNFLIKYFYPSILLSFQLLNIKCYRLFFRYKENAMIRSTIVQDRQNTAMESAIYWIEYVLRHNGANHLKPARIELSLFEILGLDILLFLLVIPFLLITLLKPKAT